MAAPAALKRLGNQVARVDTDVPVRLFGPGLFHFTTKSFNGAPVQSAADREQEWVDAVFNVWDATLITQWIFSEPILTAGPTQTMYLNHFDALVALCNTYGRYIMFVWTADNHNGTHTKVIDERGGDALAALALRYVSEPAVIFAVQSEPPINDSAANWTTVKNACNMAISKIRAKSANVLIGVPGTSWSQNVTRIPANPVSDTNVFVKVHLYEGRLSSTPTTMLQNINGPSGAQNAFDSGYPVVVGECAIGNRSNKDDLDELMVHAELHNWGWQGWALGNNFANQMVIEGATSITSLTTWGIYTRDKSQYFATLTPPDAPEQPDPPPVVAIPSPSTKLIEAGVLNWTDTSLNTTVTPGASWVTVEHTGSNGGFQLSAPGAGTVDRTTFREVHLLVHASTAQLNALLLRVYQDHDSGTSATLGSLASYATDVGGGWKRLTIPFTDISFDSFDTQNMARIELENQSGSPLSPYHVSDWALVHIAVPASIEVAVQPLTSPAGQPIGGVPTARVLDADSNPLPGITVLAKVPADIGKAALHSASVTTKVTNSNGLAVFDFLVISVEDIDYQLELEVVE